MISNIIDSFLQGNSNCSIFLLIVNLILCLYPIIGALYWFWGGVSYLIFRSKEELTPSDLELSEHPFITIMVPAHNEEKMIASTIKYLLNDLNYDNYEVLVVDDGSSDHTPQILKRLQAQYSQLRVLRIEDNQGKAHAFNVGMFFARGEYILSNDAEQSRKRTLYLNIWLIFCALKVSIMQRSRLIWMFLIEQLC